MQIRLPKPLHGWRMLAGEVGIIVIGVLIALGFGQVVTWLDDRASASETRASIKAEIAENLRFMLRRQRTEGCMQSRLREISAFLDATSDGRPPTRPTWIGAPYAPLLGDTVFKSTQSAGKFFLLPAEEQHGFDIFYVDARDFNEQNTREWYDWAQLRALTSSSARLTESDVTRLRQALQDARGADWFIREDIAEFIKLGGDANIVAHDHPVSNELLAPACIPMNTPYAQAAAKTSRNNIGIPE
jgi:hypothetical protein